VFVLALAAALSSGCSRKAAGPLTDAQEITAGGAHACALRTGGKVVCWGDNSKGQLGTSLGVFGADSSPRPVAVEGLPPAVHVSAGETHTCAIDQEGAVWCWGSNHFGEIGKPDLSYTAAHPSPARVPGTGRGGLIARSVHAGVDGTCVLADGRQLACWGSFNELGGAGLVALTGNRGPGMAPDPQVLPVYGVTNVARGRTHTCVTTSRGLTITLSCWGVARENQLARPPSDKCENGVCKQLEEVAIPGVAASDIAELAASACFTCARTKAKDLHCWQHGPALAPGSDPKLATPQPAPGAARGEVTAVAAHAGAVCWLQEGGAPRCFGAAPKPPPITGATQIAVGNGFACALVSGAVRCWGDDARGQLASAAP
jgi:alpha-tubulin suppressor-like RCC1 family protein